MTTFNTGNPIGSVDPRDLYDNAENLDEAVNTRSAESWDDRFGVARKTWWGMEQDFQQFLINTGYENIGDYAAGLEITARNQIFWKDGELYRAGAALELPYTTTGDWATESSLFVGVGDALLRQELADTSGTGNGAGMIGYTQQNTRQRLLMEYYPEDEGAIGDGVADDTAALVAWSQHPSAALSLKQGSVYLCSDTLSPISSVQGHGATVLFDIPATQHAWLILDPDVAIQNVNSVLSGGVSTNPADYGDAGGYAYMARADGVLFSRVSAKDFPNGVGFMPPADGEDIESGQLVNSTINTVGRGLTVFRLESGGVVTAQSKNILSSGNKYLLQEENLPPGAELEGQNGILVKWPSDNFKSINDVIRNSAEHAVYAQGRSMYFENIDMEKQDSPHGDGLKISCPDGGAEGIGRFATAVVKGIRSRGYRCGVHGQFRTLNCVIDGADIDVSDNTTAAAGESFGIRFSNPSSESTGLTVSNLLLRGARRSHFYSFVGGVVRASWLDGSFGALEDVFVGFDQAAQLIVDGLTIHNSNPAGGFGLYIGLSVGNAVIENADVSGLLSVVINNAVKNSVELRDFYHGGVNISTQTGQISFALATKPSSVSPLSINSASGVVMPTGGTVKNISVSASEQPSGGYVTVQIRKNFVTAYSFNAQISDFASGRYTFAFNKENRVFFEKGDYLQVAIGPGTATWGSNSTPLSATVGF